MSVKQPLPVSQNESKDITQSTKPLNKRKVHTTYPYKNMDLKNIIYTFNINVTG